ncbi:ATP-dependent Lon protease [Desulfobaculum xiamenense]|uniref:Lon protease n=1 Tax=Desulfobaculum xiamenense TaxID=995050 RepID=A0A846QIT4_9BACT|nr:endopeptidase La [Desulfobaculum xiamenense]NJB66957.1 ATP-dependent Lon protease [Desulfobaculum xiamenense]
MSDFLMVDNDPHSADILLPLMSLREVVMFPRSIVPLFVGREASVKAIETALSDFNKKIFLVAQRSPEKEKPEPQDLFEVGTVSKILQLLRLPDGTIKVLFEGLYRARWSQEKGFEPIPEDLVDENVEFPLVTVARVDERTLESSDGEALVRATHESLEEYGKVNKKLASETIMAISSLTDPGRLADALMPHLKADYVRKQALLEEEDPIKRLEDAYTLLQGEIEIAFLEKKIKSRVKSQMEGNQREYYLNEQLKAINKEMGREEDPMAEVADIEKRLAEKVMPDENREKALREIKKLRQIPPSSAEYTVVRNYVDWILDLPWNVCKETDLDIEKARDILEADHYGLKKPKERILEYLAVQKLVGTMKGPILCLVGPPGVGKTSLSKSIARATGREFVRLSLGGVRDEAEIRGHRRTYVGALPGKIIQALKRVKFNNPVFCLDEVDKMSTDFRGDPSAALLEVLDPEQNYTFNDHYLDMDYDLSKVFFITTANSLHSIPLPLQDRMEIIRLPGYLETEKTKIAKQFLVPKQIKEHGLNEENVVFSDNAVLEIIRRYTREAGVRNLEREIATVCRKTAMKLVEENDLDKAVRITVQNLPNTLGVAQFRYGEKEELSQVGVSTGLAYTELGGELLVVETALMAGTGQVSITGKLGDVMQESAKAAVSYIRSRSELFGLKPDFYKSIDIHVHVPEGAIPKDGPSAGITLATSLVSALLNLPVSNEVAMTGEITLRGRVLPIGGLREKLLAAHRGLIKTVLIPKENAKDLKEVPGSILRDLKIIEVENMDEVLEHALICPSPDQIFSGRGDNVVHISQTLLKEHCQNSRTH